IFSGNFFISINNIKSYLEIESLSHAQDTATSLGLSISPYSADPSDPIIETMMNAIFDRGYYKEIVYLDKSEKKVIHLENKEIFKTVPKWFKELVPMQGATASTRLSNGWTFGGTIQVTSNPGYAYFKLYEQAKDAFVYALIAFSIAMVILLVFVKLLLQPLKRIEHLATQIAKGRFETIKNIPWTTEVKKVALAMNFMSKKIEGVISKLDKNLSKINNKLKQDRLTGLGMKTTFMTRLKEHFMEKSQGYVVFTKIDDLAFYAKDHNGKEVEELLIAFSKLLSQHAKKEKHMQAFRFFGAEFALLCVGLSKEELQAWFDDLKTDANALSEQFGKNELYHMGAFPFNAASDLSATLAGADEAYEQAKIIGPNAYVIKDDTHMVRNMDDWHALVVKMIDSKAIEIDFVGSSVDFENKRIFMKELFTKVVDEEGAAIPIGTFVSLAEKYEKITSLDKTVIDKVITHLKRKDENHEIAINLSMDTVRESTFRSWLFDHLNKIPVISQKLVFTVTAYSGAKDIQALEKFIEFVHRLGSKVMIKRFESHSIALDVLKDLDVDYIRLARDYTQGVSRDNDKQAFVEGIQELGDLLRIKILAERTEDEDAEFLESIGLFGIEG
ncbi:MAG: EAL domain-containing protein, partial [Thiovulaceae bacterium]|nr:EAL domain-containing protein [Sulfurimonadaceae bacterium]